MKEYQSHIIALAGTLLLLLILLLMLLKLSIVAPIQLEDEGIVITFGDADEGGGMPDVLPMPDPITQVEQQPSAPAPTPVQPSDNELMVQEDEESLTLAQQNEDLIKREAEEQELIRKQREEEARIEAERIEREKALAEQKAREEEAIKKAQAMAALFGQAGSTVGSSVRVMSVSRITVSPSLAASIAACRFLNSTSPILATDSASRITNLPSSVSSA